MQDANEVILDPDLLKATVLGRLPLFESLCFEGVVEPKIHYYHAILKDQPIQLFVSKMIAREEALAWKSFQDLLDHAFKMAEALMQDFYEFELLFFRLDSGLENFVAGPFSRLLINHAKKLEPGGHVLIQYGSLFGILKKRIPEAWGKIDFKSPVEVYAKPPAHLDLYIKKLFRDTVDFLPKEGRSMYLLCDLSRETIFKFGQEEQTSRMASYLGSLAKKLRDSLPEIYMVQHSQSIELFTQFGLRS